MPVTQNIGNGIQTLDIGGIIQSASELSRLTLLKQQIASEQALAPLKYQEAVTGVQKNQAETEKFKADTGKINIDTGIAAQNYQNNIQKLPIELADQYSKAVTASQEAARNGDPSGLAGVARIQSQNPYATVVPVRVPGQVGPIYQHIDSRTGQPLVDAMTGQAIPDYDPFAKEKSDPVILSQQAERQNNINLANQKWTQDQRNTMDGTAIKFAKDVFNSPNRDYVGTLFNKVYALDKVNSILSQGGVAIPPRIETLKADDPVRVKFIQQVNRMNPQLFNEVNTAFASALANGVATEGGVNRQVPESLALSYANLKQRLFAKPEQANQGEFLAQLAGSVNVENGLGNAKLNQAIYGMFGPVYNALGGTPYGKQQRDTILKSITDIAGVNGANPNSWVSPEVYKQGLNPDPYKFTDPLPSPSPNISGSNQPSLGVGSQGAPTQGNQAPVQAAPQAPTNYMNQINDGLFDQ
jgi:hypothetical protein